MSGRAVSLLLLLLSLAGYQQVAGQCMTRSFGFDSFVCVCNATYCDEVGSVQLPDVASYSVYTSTRDGLRLQLSGGSIEDTSGNPVVTIDVITTTTYQEMIGFGGAMTDATGINLNSLSAETRENALRAYFAPEGIEYTVIRTPIGGSDFSTRPYSLDDVEGDVDLEQWALQPEDYEDKIPHILRAMELSSQDVYLFGSPWSPPTWMKTIQMFNGTGALLPEMWQPWANYIVKWVHAYIDEGVPVWGLTPQNEPLTYEESWPINACKWSPEDMRDWIKGNLGPSLDAAGYSELMLMVHDFNRDKLPDYVIPLLEDPECNAYIDGVAVHWYEDDHTEADVLNQLHNLDPTKFMLYSEGCVGVREDNHDSVKLGSWERGEQYFTDILEDLNHWATGWVDWNMALSVDGGPHWPGGAMDSPIIVNSEADEFYKQPTFYALAHLSKFMPRGSFSLEANSRLRSVKSAAVLNTDGTLAIAVLNTEESPLEATIAVDDSRFINAQLPAKSFQTFLLSATE